MCAHTRTRTHLRTHAHTEKVSHAGKKGIRGTKQTLQGRILEPSPKSPFPQNLPWSGTVDNEGETATVAGATQSHGHLQGAPGSLPVPHSPLLGPGSCVWHSLSLTHTQTMHTHTHLHTHGFNFFSFGWVEGASKGPPCSPKRWVPRPLGCGKRSFFPTRGVVGKPSDAYRYLALCPVQSQ